MSLKYECCFCKTTFPAREAIDGYAEGYKLGFLCPECGNNIQAGLQANRKISPEQSKWTFIAFLLFLPAALTLDSEAEYEILGINLGLNTWFFLLWVAFVVVLLATKPSLFTATTFFTEPVNEE